MVLDIVAIRGGRSVGSRLVVYRTLCVECLLFFLACVWVWVSVFIPCILDVRFVDVLVGFTRAEGHTGFLCLPFAVLAFIFLARNIQSLFSLVDREIEVCVLMSYNRSPLVG